VNIPRRRYETLAASFPSKSDAAFTYAQMSPASTWVIVHNLGKHPAVVVVDSSGSTVYGDIHYDSNAQVTLTFAAGFAGNAYLN